MTWPNFLKKNLKFRPILCAFFAYCRNFVKWAKLLLDAQHLTTHAEVAELKNLVAQKDEEIKCLNAQVEVLMRTLQGKKD